MKICQSLENGGPDKICISIPKVIPHNPESSNRDTASNGQNEEAKKQMFCFPDRIRQVHGSFYWVVRFFLFSY